MHREVDLLSHYSFRPKSDVFILGIAVSKVRVDLSQDEVCPQKALNACIYYLSVKDTYQL